LRENPAASRAVGLASGQLSVEQSPEWRGVIEGQNGTVTCTYSSTINRLHCKGSETQEPNFTADHDPGQKWSSLQIRGCQLWDTAHYLCAVETQ
uniref:Immunoglobulin V-set domain-containing protein n=1 Tax=Gopherus evgoodei TaxID=1825980 RepID=A0A8C4Y534_9SAUR